MVILGGIEETVTGQGLWCESHTFRDRARFYG